jgi:Ca-activated chloride channel family protein
MDSVLQLDHYAVDGSQSPNGTPGVIVRVLLTLSGSAPPHATRPPIGLSFVIDRSGSMGGERIDAARSAAARAVERLHPDDVVSVVAFDDRIETVAIPDRRARHLQLAAMLQQIDARGSTNLSGGWLRGREHMQHAQGMIGTMPGSSRRILLLTDGHANVGITDASTLVELARTARRMGITTTTVGVGEGYDDALLRAMADAGGGSAWYIERPDQSHDVLAEELGNLLSISAQGLQVQLSLSDTVSVIVVHSDWATSHPGPGTFAFDLGDLYAAEPKPLLLELFVPQDRLARYESQREAIATLHVSVDVLTTSGSVECRSIRLPIASSLEGQRHLEPEVEFAVLLARAAKARETAAQQQRRGRADEASSVMRAVAADLSNNVLANDPQFSTQLAAQAADMAALADKYEQRTYSEMDAKYQMQRTYNQRRGKKSYDDLLQRKPPE